jgi:hypothetical protein
LMAALFGVGNDSALGATLGAAVLVAGGEPLVLVEEAQANTPTLVRASANPKSVCFNEFSAFTQVLLLNQRAFAIDYTTQSCDDVAIQFSSHRGRTASYPAASAQNPGVQFSRTGLFSNTRDRRRAKSLTLFVIARREVCIATPGRHARSMFPLQATYYCQPLPRVSGSPAR